MIPLPMGEYERGLHLRWKAARAGLGAVDVVPVVLRAPPVVVAPPEPPPPDPVVFDETPPEELPSIKNRPRRHFGYVGIYDPNWRTILKTVCRKHDIHPKDVLSPSRAIPVVACRYEAIGEIYRRTNMSLCQIGRVFSRHHTTIMAALQKGGGYELPRAV